VIRKIHTIEHGRFFTYRQDFHFYFDEGHIILDLYGKLIFFL